MNLRIVAPVVVLLAAACGPGATAAPAASAPESRSSALATLQLDALHRLPDCIDPAPPATKPVTGITASGDTFATPVSLDDGLFVLTPVAATVDASVAAHARCTLLATSAQVGGTTAFAAGELGSTFGLARVSITLPLPPTPSRPTVGPAAPPLTPWHDRLAWVLMVTPEVVSSCGTAAPLPPTTPRLPGYQALVIDATTGADAIAYDARSNMVCGGRGSYPPGLEPVLEMVSVPFTVASAPAGAVQVPFHVQARSCDGVPQRTSVDSATHEASLIIERPIADCHETAGPDTGWLSVDTYGRHLPAAIRHGPVGARDVVSH